MTGLQKLLSNKYLCSLVLVGFLVLCLVTEYSNPNLRNLNKNVKYYNNLNSTPNVVISDRLKDPNTLEQEMVNNMIQTTKIDAPRLSPRYHPLLPNSAGASIVE